ncbi:TPA: hypothetical protein QCR24_004286 [Bacillus cereus]|nr:hypothetical protein [Bacillus cereus]
MPRLLKVRMSNIILDEGKKVIPDLTWSPDGRDMLFILENGGGKTSVIQLIMQTILPNSTLTGRRVKETLAKGSSGHIATSWRLDGDNPKYVVLGFSYKNANSDSEDLQYFNYYFTHHDESLLTIETLPMVENGKLITYSEYKRALQRTEEVRVRIPETNDQYKSELQQFQILIEEWKNMQKINGDEGEVTEFFEKAKTIEELIKKLFIPSIEDTIFRTKKEKKGIYESFKEFKDNLLKIPELRQNLHDFQIIQENANSVIQSVANYKKIKSMFYETLNRLIKLRKTFDLYKEELQKTRENLEKMKQQLKAKQDELCWKIDSFTPYKIKQEMVVLQNELQDMQKKLLQQEKLARMVEQRYKETKAMHHYGEYMLYRREKQSCQAELDAFELSHTELMKRLEDAKHIFTNAWNYTYKEKKQKEEAARQQLRESETGIEKIKQMITTLRNRGKTLTKESADIEAELKHYEKDRTALELELGYEAVCETMKFIRYCKKTNNQKTEQITNIKQDIKNTEEQKKSKEKFVQDKMLDIGQWKHDKQNEERAWEQYEIKKERIKNMLLRIGKPISCIWEEHDELVLSIQKQLEQLISDKEKLALIVQQHRNRVEDLRAYDYFIPHKTLLRIKEQLEQKRIYVVLGSEWLSQQMLDKEEKENILEHNRLLPYSLLVEEGQIKQVERILRSQKGKRFEIPILFQVKEQLINSSETDMPILLSMQQGVLVFQPLETKLFASREEMERILQEEELHLHTNAQNLKQYKEQEQLYHTVLQEVTAFFQAYDSGYDEASKKRIASLEEKEANAIREMEEFHTDILYYEKLITDLKDKHKQQEKRKVVQIRRLEKAETFIKRYPDIQSIKRVYTEKQAALVSTEQEITMNEQMQDEAMATSIQFQRIVTDQQNRLEQHKKMKNTYGFLHEFCEGAAVTEDIYETVKIMYDQLNKQMEQQSGNYEHIQKLLTAAQRNENREKKRFTSSAFWRIG